MTETCLLILLLAILGDKPTRADGIRVFIWATTGALWAPRVPELNVADI